MKSHRLALVALVASISCALLGASLAACATADLIEAPPFDAEPSTVVSESGTGDAADGADAADGGSDAPSTTDAGAVDGSTDASAPDAATDDASRDAPSAG